MGDDLLTSMSMLNSSIQNASNAYLTSKASKDDRKFAEAMYQRQVEDARANWMMQNEYNSPAAQRDRMINAQINPAVAWAKGLSADTGNSSEPEMATPLSWNKRIPAGLSQINPFEQLAAVLNAEKVKAEVKKLGADTKNIDKATEQTELEIARGKFEFELDRLFKAKDIDASIKEKLANVQKMYSDALTTDRLGELYYFQSLIEGENYNILKEKHPYLIEELQKTIDLLIEKRRTEISEQRKNKAIESTTYKEGEYVDSKKAGQNEVNRVLKNDADFSDWYNKSDKLGFSLRRFEGIRDVFANTFKFNQVLANLDLTKAQIEQVKAAAAKARSDANWSDALHLLDVLNKSGDFVTTAAELGYLGY